MAKIYGTIGFAEVKEDPVGSGIWKEVITPRQYCMDLNRNHRRLQGGEKVNSDITLNNEISIVADPIARENFHSIRYVEFMGAKWKVNSVDVQYPRLVLTMGEVYNG